MHSPSLPKVTNSNHTTPSDSEHRPKFRLMRSNLKRTLSKEIQPTQDELFPADDQNQFLLDENNSSRRFIAKSIVKNENMETPLLSDSRKQLKFVQTHVHEVENWKEYNKPERCCYCCILQ